MHLLKSNIYHNMFSKKMTNSKKSYVGYHVDMVKVYLHSVQKPNVKRYNHRLENGHDTNNNQSRNQKK